MPSNTLRAQLLEAVSEQDIPKIHQHLNDMTRSELKDLVYNLIQLLGFVNGQLLRMAREGVAKSVSLSGSIAAADEQDRSD